MTLYLTQEQARRLEVDGADVYLPSSLIEGFTRALAEGNGLSIRDAREWRDAFALGFALLAGAVPNPILADLQFMVAKAQEDTKGVYPVEFTTTVEQARLSGYSDQVDALLEREGPPLAVTYVEPPLPSCPWCGQEKHSNKRDSQYGYCDGERIGPLTYGRCACGALTKGYGTPVERCDPCETKALAEEDLATEGWTRDPEDQ